MLGLPVGPWVAIATPPLIVVAEPPPGEQVAGRYGPNVIGIGRTPLNGK